MAAIPVWNAQLLPAHYSGGASLAPLHLEAAGSVGEEVRAAPLQHEGEQTGSCWGASRPALLPCPRGIATGAGLLHIHIPSLMPCPCSGWPKSSRPLCVVQTEYIWIQHATRRNPNLMCHSTIHQGMIAILRDMPTASANTPSNCQDSTSTLLQCITTSAIS